MEAFVCGEGATTYDISSEEGRLYVFETKNLRIDNPVSLTLYPTGQSRVVTADKECFDIQPSWLWLEIVSKKKE